MKTIDFNDIKDPKSKGVLPKKSRRGRPEGQKLTATIRLGITEEEMDTIAELAAALGSSYSQTVRTLLKKDGHI